MSSPIALVGAVQLLLLCSQNGYVLADISARRYDGYELWIVTPTNASQLDFLVNISTAWNDSQADFWSKPSAPNRPSQVLVSPSMKVGLSAKLSAAGLNVTVLNADVQQLIDQQFNQKLNVHYDVFYDAVGDTVFNPNIYHSYDEIIAFMQNLVALFPNKVRLHSLGMTTENRRLLAIQIGLDPSKKAIWIDAGSHAREWISISTATYIIYQLLYNPSSTESLLMSRYFNWYIMPVMNPDGYEYTRYKPDKPSDRLWRKNKRQSGQYCAGVDLNRNWDFHFAEADATTDHCAENYRGPNAFSEPETQAVRDFLISHQNEVAGYFTLHSFGQIFGYSWSYDKYVCPPDIEDLDAVGMRFANTVAHLSWEFGRYDVGTSADIVYPVGGVSNCWAKAKAGIKYSFLIELSPSISSPYGFLLPESFVSEVGQNTFAGISAASDEINKRITSPAPLRPRGQFYKDCRVV